MGRHFLICMDPFSSVNFFLFYLYVLQRCCNALFHGCCREMLTQELDFWLLAISVRCSRICSLFFYSLIVSSLYVAVVSFFLDYFPFVACTRSSSTPNSVTGFPMSCLYHVERLYFFLCFTSDRDCTSSA